MESFAIINVEDTDLDTDVGVSNDLIDNKLKDEFTKIYEELNKIQPQQKMFFLDRVITEFLIRGNLPEFYLTALLTRIKEELKTVNHAIKRDEHKYSGSYLG